MPTFGSLFAGIGGIDLGLERAGWTGRWQVEWDPYCQHVLAHHWPDVQRYGDITRVDWSQVEPVDLIAGGFPCQPISAAGRQRAQSDARWLWPEFARVVRELRPRYVLVENVRNLLAVNDGTALGEVLGDLAALGYDAEWHVISAADVGAPHRRERVWIVGRDRTQLSGAVADTDDGRSLDAVRAGRDAARDGGQDVADAGRALLEEPSRGAGVVAGGPRAGGTGAGDGRGAGDVPDADGVRGPAGLAGPDHGQEGHRGKPDDRDPQGRGPHDGPGPHEWWAVEPDVGRVAHGVPGRVDRLRALGNAVVPQVVEVVGRALMNDFLASVEGESVA